MNLVQLIRSLAANQAALAGMTADEAQAVREWANHIIADQEVKQIYEQQKAETTECRVIFGGDSFLAEASGERYLQVWAWVENVS